MSGSNKESRIRKSRLVLLCKHFAKSVVAAVAIAATVTLFSISAYAGNSGHSIETPNQIFRFRPGRMMFYADYHENLDKARQLANEVRENIDRIRSGEIIIRVEGYATSYGSPRSNLKAAANRSNQVKSYLILYAGVKEENFLTKNFADTWRGMADIAAVAYLEPAKQPEESSQQDLPVAEIEPAQEKPVETPVTGEETEKPTVVPVPVAEGETPTEKSVEIPPAKNESEAEIVVIVPVPEKDTTEEIPVPATQKETETEKPIVVPVPEKKITEQTHTSEPITGKETETDKPAAVKDKKDKEEPAVKVKIERVPWQNGKGVFYPKIGIKTNLLALAGVMPDFKYYTPLPNLEVEWYFANRWSLAGTGAFAKWGTGNDKFFGTSAWSIEPRVWIWGDARYRWIYAGIYGQWGDFDNQRMHIDDFGHTGAFAGTGISVGAALPMTDRLMLEVGLRAGWQWRVTDVYSWEPPHYYHDYTNRGGKWGLTGAKISLMYRFGKRR